MLWLTSRVDRSRRKIQILVLSSLNRFLTMWHLKVLARIINHNSYYFISWLVSFSISVFLPYIISRVCIYIERERERRGWLHFIFKLKWIFNFKKLHKEVSNFSTIFWICGLRFITWKRWFLWEVRKISWELNKKFFYKK